MKLVWSGRRGCDPDDDMIKQKKGKNGPCQCGGLAGGDVHNRTKEENSPKDGEREDVVVHKRHAQKQRSYSAPIQAHEKGCQPAIVRVLPAERTLNDEQDKKRP